MNEQQNSTGSTGLMDKVRQGATSQLSTQKNMATDGIGTVAQAVRQASEQLRTQQHDTIAGYIDQAANQLEQFSTRLRDKDVGELMRDAQDFARRRPAVFIGSAFAVGLLGARFLKSSRDRQYGNGRNTYASSSTGYREAYPSRPATTSPSTGTGSVSNARER
jgi:ElaB/YqjD/DUF883 family membrane-anchored ribosome-binding protein